MAAIFCCFTPVARKHRPFQVRLDRSPVGLPLRGDGIALHCKSENDKHR